MSDRRERVSPCYLHGDGFAIHQTTSRGFDESGECREITTGDPIWPASYASAVTAYGNAGMTLTKDNTKPGGHCAFDQQQVIKDHIASLLAPR